MDTTTKDWSLASQEEPIIASPDNTVIQAKSLLYPVRVIYTINASAQSLLARHRRKVEVVPIDDAENSTVPLCYTGPPSASKRKFAKVSLKTCLGAVCTSSPELLADRSRDYSIYVVDPLEAYYSISNDSETRSSAAPNNTRGGGVSVGVGLLSWCLSTDHIVMEGGDSDDEDGYVVGKIVKDRGTEALEIVMSLRETAPQTQQAHFESLSSLGFSGCVTPGKSECSKVTPITASFSSSAPLSTKTSVSASLPELQRQDLGTKITEECSKSSSARVGRPPGTTTHPEKRARRLAIQSHKQTLDRMQNIAKMQRGQPYDASFIDNADFKAPKVTDADIARQRQVLEELESRPLIVDKPSNLLTTKPLRKRTSVPSTIVPLSKNSGSKQNQGSSLPANALASCSGLQKQTASTEDSSLGKPDHMPGNKHGTELLLSLLTSVLSNVDGISLTQSNTTKGKEKETSPIADAALAAALGRLIPLLPGATQPSLYTRPVMNNLASVLGSNVSLSSPSFRMPHYDAQQQFHSQGSSPMHKPPSLFQTADETFNCSDRASTGLHEQRCTSSKTPVVKSDPPKVRGDAYPVPGGGWARGKNLVPRTAISTMPSTSSLPKQQVDQGTTNLPKPNTALKTPDKENMPPKNIRGLKRSSSALMDGKDSNEGAISPISEKKRKRENSAANSNGGTKVINVLGTKKTVMSPTGTNRSTSGVAGFVVAASSPIRSTAVSKPAPILSMMAASEPAYQSPSMPLVATTSFPDVIIQPPRTPPRRATVLEDDVNDSLFTPVTKSITRLDSDAVISETSLFSPSPVRRKIHGGIASNLVNTIDGPAISGNGPDSHLVRTGWDLPPSSPPPPTSPISPRANIGLGEEDQTPSIWTSISAPDGTMEKCDSDETLGRSHDTTFKCDVTSTNSNNDNPLSFTFQNLGATSDFDPLSDADFDFSILDQIPMEPLESEGIELDIEELWKSLGPVIAKAQTDVGMIADQQLEVTSFDQASFDYFGTDNNTHVEVDSQKTLDPVKLAEDLKALFGGCVV